MADLRAWRLAREVDYELPSGLTVRLRRVALLDLVSTGQMPAPLLTLIQDFSASNETAVDMAQLPQFTEVLNAVTLAAVIEPPIQPIGDEEHLGLNEMPFDDKLEIFNWLNQGAQRLAPFLQGAIEPVAAA